MKYCISEGGGDGTTDEDNTPQTALYNSPLSSLAPSLIPFRENKSIHFNN